MKTNIANMTDAELHAATEELVTRYYNRICDAANEIAIGGMAFRFTAKGRVGGGLEVVWNACADSAYITEIDPQAVNLGTAVDEALRRVGYKKANNVKMIANVTSPFEDLDAE